MGCQPIPNAALFESIKAFQETQGLKADGVINPEGETEGALHLALTPPHASQTIQAMAQAIQALGRNGDELLAHLSSDEAVLLDQITDGASINPHTGLLEFWYDYEADAAGVGSEADNRGQDKYGNDHDNDGWGNQVGVKSDNEGKRDQVIETDLNATSSNTVVLEDDDVQNKESLNRAAQARAEDNSLTGHLLQGKENKEDKDEAEGDRLVKSNKSMTVTDYEWEAYSTSPNDQGATSNKGPNDYEAEAYGITPASAPPPNATHGQPLTTVDLMTAKDKALLEKAQRLGINPDDVDVRDDLDKGLIDSYTAYGNKSLTKRRQAQDIRAAYAARAKTDKRSKAVYDKFKMAQGSSLMYTASKGSLGYLSDERLDKMENINRIGQYGFAAAGRIAKPVGIVGPGYAYLNKSIKEERNYRKRGSDQN